jgi:hypothetical protein
MQDLGYKADADLLPKARSFVDSSGVLSRVVELAEGVQESLEETRGDPITMPINDAYQQEVKEWVCTCPAFPVSRFLVRKHLVQQIHKVPSIFFLEAHASSYTALLEAQNLEVVS